MRRPRLRPTGAALALAAVPVLVVQGPTLMALGTLVGMGVGFAILRLLIWGRL